MADLFVSYARADKARVAPIVSALEAEGWSVWWDPEITPGQEFDTLITEELKKARAVVAVWTPASVASRWVRGEARLAAERGVLAPVRFEAAELPIDLRAIHTTDLDGWDEDARGPAFGELSRAIRALLGEAAGGAAPRKAVRKLSICVLPFSNISGDVEQEYFSDGISEDIITDLSKVSALGVIARNTAFQFKGKSVDVPQIARQLNVSHVVEGSVRKAGQRVRITAQLIDGASGEHAWAERWDRDLDDIFALQDEISQAIVAALKLKLLPEEKKEIERRGTASAEAYDLILMARNLWQTGNDSADRSERTIRLAERAIAVDPNYALAWVTKARAQASLVRYFGRTGDDGGDAAEQALALDPDLAEAHAVRARRRLIAGQVEAALAEVALALRLDPDSVYVNVTAGDIHYENRRFAEAARHYEVATRLDDVDFGTPGMLVSAYVALDDMENARRVAAIALERGEKVLAQDRANGRVMGMGVFVLSVLGQAERAREWIARALILDPDNHTMRYNFACASCRFLGDAEGALELLGHVLANDPGSQLLQAAKVDPDLDPIREDPRFKKMVAEAETRLGEAAKAESRA